jgi:hypothetical protein
MSLPSAYSGALKHDPEKACPGLDPGWFPGFRERSCSKLARPEHRHWVIKDGAGASVTYVKRRNRREFRHPEHDPEKWLPVFGKDHAQATNQCEMAKAISRWRMP